MAPNPSITLLADHDPTAAYGGYSGGDESGGGYFAGGSQQGSQGGGGGGRVGSRLSPSSIPWHGVTND